MNNARPPISCPPHAYCALTAYIWHACDTLTVYAWCTRHVRSGHAVRVLWACGGHTVRMQECIAGRLPGGGVPEKANKAGRVLAIYDCSWPGKPRHRKERQFSGMTTTVVGYSWLFASGQLRKQEHTGNRLLCKILFWLLAGYSQLTIYM